MASWTDNAPQYNPYVQQLPVEAMVQVGMEKQRRYDEGIERIQSSIDRVAGLDIMRDVDRNYLEEKLTNLNTQLRTFAASDFSDQQLTSSLSGLASKVGKDRSIQSAVLSTAKARKEISRMELDRQEGKLDPSNEYYFNRSLGEWLNNPEVGANFGTNYIPHFDIFKYAKEVFDQVQPDGMTFDQVFLLDDRGNPIMKNGKLEYSPYMTRLIQEGRSVDKVKQTIDNIFADPRVSQQLDISGIYNYRSLQGEDLKRVLSSQKQGILAAYEQAITQYKAQQSLNSESTVMIDKLETEKRNIEETYSQYELAADSNPDAIRSMLHRDAVRSQYSTMFGVMKTQQLVMENPAWRATFDVIKEQNSEMRWMNDYKLRSWIAQDASQRGWASLELDQAKLELERMEIEGKIGAWNGAGEFTPADQESDFGLIAHQGYMYQSAVENYGKASDKFLSDAILKFDKKLISRLDEFKKRGATEEGAIQMLIEEEAKKQGKTPDEYKQGWLLETVSLYEKMSPEERAENPLLVDSYELYRKAENSFKVQSDINNKMTEYVSQRMGNSGENMDLGNIKPQTITYGGVAYDLSPTEIADLAAYMVGQPWGVYNTGFKSIFNKKEADMLKLQSDQALRRLQEAGLGDLAAVLEGDAKRAYTVKDGDGNITYIGSKGKSPVEEREMMQRWGQVFNAADKIANFNNTEIVKHKSDFIKNTLTVKPNMKAPLFTGDLETDRNTLHKVTTFASNHSSNISPDFKDFKRALASIDLADPQGKYTMSKFVNMDTNGQPQLEIVLYENSKRVGGMVLTPSEAGRLGVDFGSLYESPEVTELRQYMSAYGGQTSKGNPWDYSTYKTGHDYYFNKYDLPGLSQFPGYDLKINIKQNNGNHYVFMYATNGYDEYIKQLKVGSDITLEGIVQTIKAQSTPAFVEQILAEKNARQQGKSNQ